MDRVKVSRQPGADREQAYGRYKLLDSIGAGSLTEVFKAKSFGVEGFEKILVIKRLRRELAENPHCLQIFIAQAKLAFRLSHANVVQVFDLGRVEDAGGASYFLATEYVSGVALSWLLQRLRVTGQRLAIPQALYIAAEIAKGLDHAHRRRNEKLEPLTVIHGDLSPQSVLLSWDGQVKVSDFCVMRAFYELCGQAHDERLRLKYPYASPEQARGEPGDRRSDVFALGSLVYACIAGKNPLLAPSCAETRQRVLRAECEPLSQLRSDLPAELVELVSCALALDPARRFQSAAELHERLMACAYAHGVPSDASRLSDLLEQLRDDVAPGRKEEPALSEAALALRPSEWPPRVGVGQSTRASKRAPDTEIGLGQFIGRRRELARLGEFLARASTKKLGVLGLVGDAGVGKTRLLIEIQSRLAQRAFNVGFYAANCPARGQIAPFGALAEMLRVLCGVREAPADHAIIEPRLRALGLTLSEVESVFGELGVVPELSASQRELLQNALYTMLHSLAEDRLHIFAWDNAEQLDRETAELLAGLTTRLAQSRTVWIFSGRAREVSHYRTIPGYVQIDVGHLEAELPDRPF
jgi:serine/threonine protein kinase